MIKSIKREEIIICEREMINLKQSENRDIIK